MSDKGAPRSLTLRELADLLGAELHGDPDIAIRGAAALDKAGPNQISFVVNVRYARQARTTEAGALLVTHQFPSLDRPTLRHENPYLAFANALALFHVPPAYRPGIHRTAEVASSAKLGEGAHVGAYVVIMDDVEIGSDAVLLPHVVIYPGARIGARFFAHAHSVVRETCSIGDDVTLQNGAIIGSDGFGFARNQDRSWTKIPQAAPVVLEERVEVQANACVDRASVGETRIGRGSKIDNLVQVGHGSTVGANTLLCSQVGLAGSTRIGDRVILAGQVGVAGHCSVGHDVTATAQSGIPGDVAPGLTVSGYPAIENRRWLRTVALVNRLPELFRNVTISRK